MDFLWTLLKSIFASIASRRAAKAAAELPQGTAATASIEADGATIEAQLGMARGGAK